MPSATSAIRLRPTLLAIAAAGFLLGCVAIAIGASSETIAFPAASTALFVKGGWAWIAVGILAWWRRPDNIFGRLMVLTGFLWFLQMLTLASDSWVFSLSLAVSDLHAAALVTALACFPSGRIETEVERRIVYASWALVLSIAPAALFIDPAQAGCEQCPANELLVAHEPAAVTGLLIFCNTIAVLLVVMLIRQFVNRYRGASPPRRRMIGPVLWTGTIFLAVMGAGSAFALAGLDTAEEISFNLGSAIFITIPLAFLFGVYRSRLVRGGSVGRLFERLASERDPEKMRLAVADALGDPSAEMAYRIPRQGRYVDAEGRPFALPGPDSGRRAAPVEIEGRRIAVIVHDGGLVEEPEKVEAVSRGAALALENVRLEAELKAKVAELTASRARIVEAGDAARRELERDLHDGAQQNLVSLAMKLKMARGRVGSDPRAAVEILDGASAELEQTLAELRELARGIHPAVLSDRGLDAALLALAHRAPLPVEVQEAPVGRLPEPVEAAAYFVVAESLTNVARYAGASRAEVEISRAAGRVTVRVADDGVGGADPARGSGLRGLVDRIEALDGNLQIASPRGGGTVVEADIPCA